MRNPIIHNATTLIALAGLMLLVSSQAASQVKRSHTPLTAETNAQVYSAEYKITHLQALTDGTTITRESTEVKALDSQGRRMTATTITSGDRAPITHVMVYDPVARTQTFWHSPGKVAHVLQMSPGAEHHCLTIARDDISVVSGPKPTYTSEDLGTESIQGVDARGRRRTTIIPAGAMGNDAPLVSTSEMWTAVTPGLNGLVLLDVRNDPRRGKTTRELTNLTQNDPDPATFLPPEGYEVVTKDSSGCQDQAPAETRSGTTTTK